ncbi:alpha/beta hydrolase [Lactobacillus delbrueckii]|uniref:alpha/beta hydrolase n=1 Tax=Lactobacillus delbrueckii TaxID=1584 RepID=UPI001F430161|nr:alpha/beta hydrolase [Lactobacillus delbrueckii]GHN55080.1 alpha/beta hydrolase superfamily protein [Lactobacillus delbrueckii]GHN58041.1 alpha/beta hydrolase superfamily protein [Lactobacillus delbrueckii]
MYVSANQKNGKPIQMNDNYKRQLVLRKLYPHVKVLNLEDGSHSDGRVKNPSSKSLRYLVSPKVKSYKEKKFTCPMAQHSRLRKNPQVLKTAISFPWPNS